MKYFQSAYLGLVHSAGRFFAAESAESAGSSWNDNMTGRQNMNDILLGGIGNDVYWFGVGSGDDVMT